MANNALPLSKNMIGPAQRPVAFDPKPLIDGGRRWSRLLTLAISLAVLVAVMFELAKLNLTDIRALIPVTRFFWIVFFASYFTGPLTDWVIFRQLWGIPATGFYALLRKQVANSLLPSYSGELYFYAWARKRTELTGAPFGAIKDVAILSAVIGNLVTLAMLALAYPQVGGLHLAVQIKTFAAPIGFIIGSSLMVMFYRGRLFSLPRDRLWYISVIIFIRVIASTLLTAVLWAYIMPDVNLVWWLCLATIKLLLTRLPFMPNQDLLFASVAIALIGHHQLPIANLVTMIASVTTLTNIIFGIILGFSDLVRGVPRDA